MKKLIIFSFIILNSFVIFAQVDRSNAPEPDIPQPLNLGDLSSFKLDNGLNIFVANKPGYTKFTISVNIQLPDLKDDNTQLRSNLNETLYQKETSVYSEGEVDSIVDYLGAKLAVTPNGGYIKGMKKDADQLLAMYSDILLNPLFSEEIINRVGDDYKKKKEKSSIKKSTISIGTILLDSLLHDGNMENKAKNEELPFQEYSIDDVKEFHHKRIVANNTLIVIMGDFSQKESKILLNKHFGNWHQGEKFKSNKSYESYKSDLKTRKIFVIDNPNAVQSKITFNWNLDDAFQYFEKEIELQVLNEILGASSMSYIYLNLREDKGLCYFATSNIGPSGSGGGGFINTSVRNSETAYAIENIIFEMLRIRNIAVTDHDLKIAKNSLIGEFARSVSGIATIPYISFAMAKEEFNLPDDYLQTRIPKIYQVTKEDIEEMAQKYIKPYNCIIMVEGKVSDLKGQLEKFGEVEYYTKDGERIVY